MNYKERGYLFQDMFSAYVILNYINKFLCGKKIEAKVILDKKSMTKDKFDDLKIIDNDNITEIQIKYRENKELIELSDFSNFSGDFNLYQFIRSYKEAKNNNACLIISVKKNNLDKELEDILYNDDSYKFFESSNKYKIKKTDKVIELFYKKRISKNKNSKIDNSDLTMDDIRKFIDNFSIEIIENFALDLCIKKKVIDKIDDGIENISNVSKEIMYNDLVQTIREYRAEDEYKSICVQDIVENWLERLKLTKFLTPIKNDLNIDYEQMISRSDDIENVMNLFKENSLIHVFGQPGVGKSWFSKEFADRLDKNNIKNSTYYFYFNHDDIDRDKRLNEYNILTTFNYNLQKIHGYNVNIFNTNIDSLKLEDDMEEHFLIFDGLDHIIREKSDSSIEINNLIKKIINFSNNNKKIKILVISQPLDNMIIKSKYEIKNLNKEQSEKLIEYYSRRFNFSLDKLKKIDFYSNSCGNPLLIKYMISDYILNGNLIDSKITNLNDYYKLIFTGKQFCIYLYFSVLKFPISLTELFEISSISIDEIEKELKCIRNVLLVNDKQEYVVFHESLKRYILSLKQLNKEKIIGDIINWFSKKDIYSNTKKFNFYPDIILENKKFDHFKEKFDYEKLKQAIIENAYSENEVSTFIENIYKISQHKNDFKMMYYIEHFYDVYKTFLYDFDINIFENYIYMLYYSGNYEMLNKLLYTKYISKYSDGKQQWDYMSKIIIFLLKNNYELNYEEVINKFTKYFKDRELIRIDKLNIPFDSSSVRIIYSYLQYKNIKDLSKISNNLKPTSELFKIINSLLKRDTKKFIIKFLEKDIIIKRNKKSLNDVILTIKEEKYLSSSNNFILLINKIFDNHEDKIEYYFKQWDNIFSDIPKVYKFVCTLVKNTLEDKIKEEDIKTFFNDYSYNDLIFSGSVSNYSDNGFSIFGKLFVFSKNKNLLIKEFINFKKKIMDYPSRNFNDGVVSLVNVIYNEIIENIKNYNIELDRQTLNMVYYKSDYKQSNVNEFENSLINYTLSLISKKPNIYFKKDIFRYMFSYGSYRDIQIWELEDILKKMININKMDINKFIELMCIAFNAVERMDRAKDVWHIPNELLKLYADKVSSVEALNVFFSYLETFDYDIREKDELFAYLYEKIGGVDNRKVSLLYNYWKFMNKNILYQFSSKETELKKCIKLANKKEYNFIKQNVLSMIKNEDYQLKYNDIEDRFKRKKDIVNYIYIPDKSYKIEERYTNMEKYNSLDEIVNKVNDSYFDCSVLNYTSLVSNIKAIKNKEHIYELFININNSSNLNTIFKILEKNKFDYKSIDEDIIIELLVGLYYRSNGYVSNMAYDEIFEKALQISPKKATITLKKYIVNDKKIQLGNKSGKIFKYLIEDDEVNELYEDIIEIYFSRLPNYLTINRFWDVSSFDKNDILLNYFLIKSMNGLRHYQMSITEDIILIRLFEIKKFTNNKIVYMKNDYDDSLSYIMNWMLDFEKNLKINFSSFLNFKNKNNYILLKYELNKNRTKIIKTNNSLDLDDLLLENSRGLIIMEEKNVYKYEANLIQVYNDNIADKSIKYKLFQVFKVPLYKMLLNKLQSKIRIKIYKRKILKTIKKDYIFFNNYKIIYLFDSKNN